MNNYTIKIFEGFIDANDPAPTYYETIGKINSLNFKKGTMSVSYKNRYGKRKTQDFPIRGFFEKYKIDMAGF